MNQAASQTPRLAMARRVPAHMTRALADLVLALVVVVGGALLFTMFDAVERIATLTAALERAEVDDFLLALALASVMATWFAARRWSESRSSLIALQASQCVQRGYVSRLEELSGELLSAEERERNRVAELVHDDLGQALYACRLRLSVLTRRLPEGELRGMSEELELLTGEALTRARDLSMQLSPPALSDLGVAEALETLVPTLARRYPVQMSLEPSPAFASIPMDARGPVFHSVKELVLNAIKHANAAHIAISARHVGAHVEVSVLDDGEGFDPSTRAQRQGFGLFSIERRMACLGAELRLESTSASGTVATLRVIAPQTVPPADQGVDPPPSVRSRSSTV